jgi:CelD/BcsL family acetyltransferase involved in cellulose biosynthesis
MEISVVSAWDELPGSALRLLADFGQECLFCGDSWFGLFSRQVAEPNCSPCWLLLLEDDTTVLILPMMIRRDGKTKTLCSLSNYYTPYFSHVGPRDKSPTLLQTLFELAANFMRTFDAVEFFPLTESTKDVLLRASKGLSFSPEIEVQTHNWRQLGIEDFAQYWSTRDSRLRNTVLRKQRKLDALGDFHFSVVVSEEIDQAIADYHAVYAESWKPTENFPDFIDNLMRIYSREGKLRLGLARHGDKPIAAQIWLLNAGTAYIYKLAYDQQYENLSIGTLLTRHLFQFAIDVDGVHTVDYLTGDDGYKAQWMGERRPLHRLTLANPRRPRGATLVLKHNLRRILRSVPSASKGQGDD